MLPDIQARLATHFADLRRTRAVTGSPVFAIEHPFSSTELAQIQAEISKASLQRGRIHSDAWLVWVVLAAEAGYAFAGDEYWQSFARDIDCWSQLEDRNQLRDWFVQFAHSYNGFRPFGPWAKHRTIISWPISHAILPQDLQIGFMREFHGLRHSLAEIADASTEEIGKVFAAKAQGASSRLRCFLEQAPIVGRLIVGLTSSDATNIEAPIAPATLARIVADLEQDDAARTRLSEARRTFQEARLRVSRQLTPNRANGAASTTEASTITRFDPVRVGAMRSSSGGWSLLASLPSLRDAVERSAELRTQVSRASLKFLDSPDRWRPGSVLLQTVVERPLAKLPAPNALMVDFDGAFGAAHPEMCAAYTFPAHSQWLLRLQEDGRARVVAGNYVRPKQTYLVVARAPLADEGSLATIVKSAETATAGVHVYELAMPASAKADQLSALGKLGIGYRLAISIDPVGLCPRQLLEDGASDWLTTEEIILGLSADHEVQQYVVTIDDRDRLQIDAQATPQVLFSLGCLGAGLHEVAVDAMTGFGTTKKLLSASLRLRVRPPEKDSARTASQAGIFAGIVPANARLESLLDGEAKLFAIGPYGREVDVSCECQLSKDRPIETVKFGPMRLPLAAERLRTALRAKDEILLASVTTTFIVDCGELGHCRIPVEHETDPLRWIVQKQDTTTVASLIDETDQPVKLYHASVSTPDKFTPIHADPRTEPLVIGTPGALLCASLDGRQYPVLISVPVRGTVSRLEDLGLRMILNPNKRNRDYFTSYLSLLKLWSAARVYGSLALLRRQQIVEALRQRLLAIACGDPWAESLVRLERAHPTAQAIADLQRFIGGSVGFGPRLKRGTWSADIEDLERNIEQMQEISSVYKVCLDRRRITAATKFAFAPTSLHMKRRDPFAAELLDERILLRGATFASLLARTNVVTHLKIA